MGAYPSAASQLKIQQPENPIEQAGQLMNLKRLMAQQAMIPGQQQLQQQQIQSGQQELQMNAQKLQDQQAMTSAMHEWDGKDLNALPSLILKHNGSAQAVFSTKNQILEYQKNLQEMDKNRLANEKVKNDYFAQAIDNVKGLPPEQQAQGFEQAKQDAVQKGYLDPQSAQGMQYQNPQQLDLLEKTLMGHGSVIEQTLKQAEAAKNAGQAREANASAVQKEQLNLAGGSKEFRESKYQFILNRIKQGLPVGDEDLNYAKAYEAGETKTTTQSDSLGVTSSNTSKPAGLAAVGVGQKSGGTSPNTKESIVDMVGQYKLNPSMLMRLSAKHPEVLAAVGQKYPDWDQTNYMAKNKAMQSFTSGPYSRQINATNIALDHLGVLGDAIDGLKNSDLKVLNRIANSYGLQTGNSAVTVFNTIAHKLAPELAQAYIQGGGGEGERGQIQRDYDASLGPDQLKSNLAVTARLLQPNIETLQQQYKNTVGRDDFQQRFLTPGAQKSMQRFTGSGQGQQSGQVIYARDPQGKLHAAPVGTQLPQGWKLEQK